ncbi:MAG: hypothetical protein C0601_02430 [Candidatus Muiribacterium halophilum]|uniref:GGDEF domain-containing protein n=1 Tax=Muiribacterium halophilum TaxID=2053465 RepID=A0A2N5ZKG5_MUIH1|nr:MAG: hypothetical protein C0601_02430 [Candidatus Muirbacterium halophilum]
MNFINNLLIINFLQTSFILVLVVLLWKKNRKDSFNRKNNSGNDNEKKTDAQVYRHFHLEHLINVEIERAERYQFGFSLVGINFKALLDNRDNYKKKQAFNKLLQRSTRIIDFIVEDEKEGYVYLVLPESDEEATFKIVDRITSNIKGNPDFSDKVNKVMMAFVCYPADATTKDLLVEYLYSVLSKIDEENPVKSYSSYLNH